MFPQGAIFKLKIHQNTSHTQLGSLQVTVLPSSFSGAASRQGRGRKRSRGRGGKGRKKKEGKGDGAFPFFYNLTIQSSQS